MAQFYDQDNPRASYSSSSTARDMSRYEGNSVRGNYENHVQNLVKNSTSEEVRRERARVIKAQQRRQARQKRLATLAVFCMLTGGVAAGFVGEVIDLYHDSAIVYDITSEFRKDVIYPNTHRTYDNQHYWYDYAKIADALEEDGKDFSSQLYMAYSDMGEYQVNRVMQYTDYDSVEDYVKASGFDSIKEWKKSEREKLILMGEINEKTSELDAMHRELNGSEVLDAVPESYVGGK